MAKSSQPRWATIIPLVGGSAIGCSLATGNKPEYHLSYKAFEANEKYLTEYWKSVPRISLDEGGQIPAGEIDFVNSVCPCAGLSQLNTSKSIETRESRNYWMYESARKVLGEVRPRVFWGENAPALFTNSGSYVREKLIEIGKEYGYTFSLYKTNCKMHGIPQRRVRTFYFFWRDTNPAILDYYDRDCPTFVEHLSQIPEEATLQDEFNFDGRVSDYCLSYGYILKHLRMDHETFVKNHDHGSCHSVFTYLVDNELINGCIEWIESTAGECKELNRLKRIRDKVASGGRFMDGSPYYARSTTLAMVGRTLTGCTHPVEERGLSFRELMHMMGLPHDFQMANKRDLNVLAQNVPTCTARDMALEVVAYLKGDRKIYDEKILMQDNIKQKIVQLPK